MKNKMNCNYVKTKLVNIVATGYYDTHVMCINTFFTLNNTSKRASNSKNLYWFCIHLGFGVSSDVYGDKHIYSLCGKEDKTLFFQNIKVNDDNESLF